MTNEEKTEVMEAVEMNDATNKQEQSRKERVLGYFKRNKKQCGVVAGALVLVVAGGGLAIATGNINPVDTLTGVNNNSTTSSAHSTTKANDAKNTSAMDADAQSTNDNESAAEATSTDGSSSVDTTSSDTNANGSTQGASGATNASNGNSGASTASSSNSQQQASTPAHQHSWSPVYKTVHHDAVTQQITTETHICNTCGADLGNSDESGAYAHLINNNHSSFRNANKYETKVITPAWDESVISYYSCSCGQTKNS